MKDGDSALSLRSFERRSLSRIRPGRSLLLQLTRGALLGLVLVPTILIWVGVGSAFFGYRAVNAHGTSMEPVLRDGDALWVKYLDPAEVKVGDIVTLLPPGDAPITHRVGGIEPMPRGGFIFQTKGDANEFSEWWEVAAEEKIAVAFVRVPFAGYVLSFLASIFGRALWVVIIVAGVIALWLLRRRRLTQRAR